METIMSETPNIPPEDLTPAQDAVIAEWQQNEVDYQRRSKESRPANKAALFTVLAAAGITLVAVHFDGYGDSGQIESIEAKAGDEPAELPDKLIEILEVKWGCSDIERQTLTIPDAVEHLAYAFLQQTHAGWENDAGGFGDFIFSVAEQTITLDYNERYESSENYTHEF
jgi:hypothetical protein